ncbi:MAG: hypothetical protein Q9162_001318 [Coniocarpon cinnabarinum]
MVNFSPLNPFKRYRQYQWRDDEVPDLRTAIKNGDLWHQSDDERSYDDFFLKVIEKEFPKEMDLLKRADATDPIADPKPRVSVSPAGFLHGISSHRERQYHEVNRTLVGLLALRWIWTDDYDKFTWCQNEEWRLDHNSFAWLRALFKEYLCADEDIYALIVVVLINDLGKVKDIADLYPKRENEVPTHDMILYYAAQYKHIEALERLNESRKKDIMAGIKLGAVLNLAQLAQAECPPASLRPLKDIKPTSRAYKLRYLECILDVCGASGHSNWEGAKEMSQPVFESYRTVRLVADAVAEGKHLATCYNIVLTRKLEFLHSKGYRRSLKVDTARDRALLRLDVLARADSDTRACRMAEAFEERISEVEREQLTIGLIKFGEVGDPAVQVSYTPGAIRKLFSVTKDSEYMKVPGITAFLRYLSKCYIATPDEKARFPKATVLERDLKAAGMVGIVQGLHVKSLPELLEQKGKVPPATVLSTE